MNQSRPRKQSQPQLINDESSRSQLFVNDSIHRGSITSTEDDRMSRAESVKDMDENIRVFIRVKPDLKTDPNPYNYSLSETYLKVKDNNTINIHNSAREVVKSFSYEYILNEKYKQEEVFMISTAPLIKHAIMGYNSTIFVYGQTGSGKTYTMGMLNQLNETSNGVLPLSLKYLFEYFEEVKQREEENYNWDLSVSLIQIYLDNIMDLLNPKGDYLQIREDPDTKETYLQDLVNVPVENLQQTMLLINAGLAARTQAAQRMNQTSSRSHLVMLFNIRQEFIDTNNKRTQLFSQLTMIDLAGSERVRKTVSSGLRLEEAKFINSSLNSLGNVISALQNPNKPFIPYRASKLTRILQNSLNGDAKIALIATISKASSNINETISTLQFASRCREIQLKPQINYLQHDDSEEETEIDSQAPSVYENQQSVKEFNYESESVLTKNNQLLQQQKEYSELLGYVFELIPTLKRYITDKIPDIHSIRENYLSEILEELRNKVKIEDLHMNEAETQIYLKNQELLEELDKIYPILPQEMPHEEDEDDLTITGKSPDQLLNVIQKAARPIIDNMNSLIQNSINFERLKLHFIKREARYVEMEDQIEQLIKLTQKLLKSNKTLYGQNVELKYPNVTLDDRLRLLNQHNQDLLNLIKGQLNIKETRVANQSELLDKILTPSFSDSAKKAKLKSPLGTGLQDYYENLKAATSMNATHFDIQEPQKIDRNLPNLNSDPVAAISVLQSLKTDFIESAIKETHEDKPEIDSSADESISLTERVSTTGPENSNLRVLTNMSENNPPSAHEKPKKYYIGDGNPQKRIDTFDNTLQISENTRELSHLLASGKGKENIPNESFEVSIRIARNNLQELPDFSSKRDSFRYFSHKDQDHPSQPQTVDEENSLQQHHETLNVEKVTKKLNKKSNPGELSAYEKILQRKNPDPKQGLRSSRTSSQSKTKDSGNYSSMRDSKTTPKEIGNENKFSSVKSDKPNLPVPPAEISHPKNQQTTIPLPLPLPRNEQEVSLGKQSQSFAPIDSMRSSKLSIEGPRNSKQSNFESLQRETEEERKIQTFANLPSDRQQTIQDSIVSLSKPIVKSNDPLPARIPKNTVFHTHQTSESQSSLLVSDKRSERKNTHENNYFSLSVKEANSIMRDELSEPAANASPLRLRESSYFAAATLATGEKPEMCEYWSFSKKENEMKPHQEYEDLTERIENLDTSILNKTNTVGDERKTININDISKIPNLASYQKEHEDEKSVQFFLKQISPFKEGKSLAEIHHRTISPHHSHNLSVDSSHVKTQNYLTVDKLNKKRLREYNNRFFSQKKSFSSHPVKRHDTTIGNMSLEELSVSFEKINPRKYEDVSPSALAKAEGLGDKSFDEIIPTSMKKIYEDKKENDPYIEYVAESYKSRKKSPIDRYQIQDKILNFENKPVTPRITKVVNELDSSKEEPSISRKRSLSSKLGVRWGKIFDWKKDKTKNIYKDKFNS